MKPNTGSRLFSVLIGFLLGASIVVAASAVFVAEDRQGKIDALKTELQAANTRYQKAIETCGDSPEVCDKIEALERQAAADSERYDNTIALYRREVDACRSDLEIQHTAGRDEIEQIRTTFSKALMSCNDKLKAATGVK